MENYFNYFTEIEEHFQKRFGGALLLSTVDWALIEVWKDAGIPLEAVLQGIDITFEHYESRPSKTRRVNSLGFCAQEVLAAAEGMKEAAVGSGTSKRSDAAFKTNEIVAHLRRAAQQLSNVKLPEKAGISVSELVQQTAKMLGEIAAEIETGNRLPRLEDLERRLTVAEEKLFAVLLVATPDAEIVNLRAEADRELAPYRSKMPMAQIEQLQKQYIRKRLLEKHGLPRLSLFYM